MPNAATVVMRIAGLLGSVGGVATVAVNNLGFPWESLLPRDLDTGYLLKESR